MKVCRSILNEQSPFSMVFSTELIVCIENEVHRCVHSAVSSLLLDATLQKPCVSGIPSNRILENLEVSLRWRSFETLRIFALTFPESSVALGNLFLPGGLEQKGSTGKMKSVPLGYNTFKHVRIVRYTLPQLHKMA